MTQHTLSVTVVVALAAAASTLAAQQHTPMPEGMTHEEHLAQMKKDAEMKARGAAAMGFDQDATTHHFRLYADGGAIEVTANDPADQPGLAAVRSHLREIADEFSRGDFARPLATHAELPPGADVMAARRPTLSFAYEELPLGGRVRITSRDETTVHAVHDFLRYQIREHKTGDTLTVGGQP